MRRHCSTVTRASRPKQQANVVYGGGALSGDSGDGDSVSIGAVGGVDGRGDGTTGDATWVQQQDGGIYGFGGTVYVLRKASEARVDRRLRRYYLIVRLLPNVFALACLHLSSI